MFFVYVVWQNCYGARPTPQTFCAISLWTGATFDLKTKDNGNDDNDSSAVISDISPAAELSPRWHSVILAVTEIE